MASVADHIARAESNEHLAARLAAESEYNWAVTLYFYAAVHRAGALLARIGIDTEALIHIVTEHKLDAHYPAVSGRYLALSSMSRRARYLPGHFADAQTVRRAARLYAEIKDFQERVMRGAVPGV